jgi:tRNA(Arg) A34 adenosine deaminase TadA
MCDCNRRTFLSLVGCSGASLLASPAHPLDARHALFIAEAVRMRNEAVARGDQSYGAVVVRGGVIVGYGPSRVVTDSNPDAHAERVALWDAQKRLGMKDMSGALIYSTSRPCALCEAALALANVERMHYGAEAADAGKPQRR